MKLEKYLWNYLVKKCEKLDEAQRHCNVCGSCRYYDYSYESQIEGKRSWVASVMQANLGYEKPIVIMPSPKQKYYRGRMDFVATKGMIGMRRSGGFNNVYDVKESCIYSEDIGAVLEKLRGFKQFPDYDLVTHEGIIRYFVTRKSTSAESEQHLLSVVVTEIPENFEAAFIEFLKSVELWEYFKVICIITQPSKADVSYGTVEKYLKGETLEQDLTVDGKTITLEVGPQSFFQANTSMFEKVLTYMNENMPKEGIENLYDLYGGVGSIGIALAQKDTVLHMAENNPENTVLFSKNCARNNIEKYNVFEGSVEEFLNSNDFEKNSVVILDPPRIGLEEKVARKFLEKKNLPETILYMSCNPSSQATDLGILGQKYEVIDVRVFDMFPYASHVEAVAVLRRRNDSDRYEE